MALVGHVSGQRIQCVHQRLFRGLELSQSCQDGTGWAGRMANQRKLAILPCISAQRVKPVAEDRVLWGWDLGLQPSWALVCRRADVDQLNGMPYTTTFVLLVRTVITQYRSIFHSYLQAD